MLKTKEGGKRKRKREEEEKEEGGKGKEGKKKGKEGGRRGKKSFFFLISRGKSMRPLVFWVGGAGWRKESFPIVFLL